MNNPLSLKTLAVIVALMATALTAWPYDFETGGLYYKIRTDGTVEVTYKERGTSYYSGFVSIPSTVTHDGTTYSVSAIGMYAFTNQSAVTGVTIPNTVTKIQYGAFYGCTSLTAVTIPNSVTSLEPFCFQQCTNLAYVTLSNNLTSIPMQCFNYCASLTSIALPPNVTSISTFAFNGCKAMRTVQLNEGLQEIDLCAFQDCDQLTELNIPASVTSISSTIVNYSDRMSRINVADANEGYTDVNGVLFTKDRKTLVAYPNAHTAHYTVPGGTVGISEYAFCGCETVESVILPTSLRSIGHTSFYGCHLLQEITIPQGVEVINDWTFGDCSALKTIDLPSSIIQLRPRAFVDATALMQIVVRATTPPECVTESDQGTDDVHSPFSTFHFSTAQLVVPRGCKAAYESAPIWQNFTSIIERNLDVEIICGDADGDGTVGIADATSIIDYILGHGDIDIHAADANGDGIIGIADVTAIIDHILGAPLP